MKIKLRIFLLIAMGMIFVLSALAQPPAEIETAILGHLDKISKHGNYGGDGDYDILNKENIGLRNAIIKFGSRADVLAYPFSKVKEKMYVTTSRDGRFRAYSWDAETGGTMHDFLTVYQFRGSSGKVHVWAPPYSEDISDYGAGSFVHQIFQTETTKGPIYLAVSTFIGSTSLAGQSIYAFTIDGEKLVTEPKVIRTSEGLTNSIGFGYDFFSVVDRPERPIRLFTFNESRREFKFPIVIEDEKTPQGRVTNKFITYRFNGTHFVKVS